MNMRISSPLKNFNAEQTKQTISENSKNAEIRAEQFNSTARVVNKIFISIQGNKSAWKQAFPDTRALDNAKIEWTKSLIENRITSMEQIKRGLTEMRKSPGNFFPSSGDFVTWCQLPIKDPRHSFFIPELPISKEEREKLNLMNKRKMETFRKMIGL